MAICFAKSLALSKIHMEGDSLIIVNAIIAGECHAWHMSKLFFVIRDELEDVQCYRVGHVHGLANDMANTIKWAVGFNEIGEARVEDFRTVFFEDF